jgi:LacI family repressor for deo operon, udp, cdd, tsx, nupC, and nupG
MQDHNGVPPERRRRSASRHVRPGSIRIDDVAALAGVSIATVSRAIANPDRVSAATRERVLEVVRRIGYTPNVAGRSLRAARSGMVLVVVPSLITPFFSELLLGIDQALSAQGYGLLIGNLHDRAEKEARLVELVFAGQADGVILLDGRVPRGRDRSLTDASVPLVGVSIPAAEGVPAVLVRDREAAAAVARHLLGLGHRSFGYVSGPAAPAIGHYIEHERWTGFAGALAAAGIPADAVIRWPGTFHLASGIEAGHRFLAATARPTAVFCISDMMALGFMRVVQDAGVIVPRDVSVVGYDGIQFADLCTPVLTTVRQPREAMGRAAAELLVRLIQGEPIPAEERTLRLDAVLRPGASTAPPPTRLLPGGQARRAGGGSGTRLAAGVVDGVEGPER